MDHPHLFSEERRGAKRFQLPEQLTSISNPAWPDRATVIDIGSGGLAMQYQSAHPWPEATNDGCRIMAGTDLFLDQLPVTCVGETIISLDSGNAMIVRRRSLQFGDLTPNQRFLLECFIWINCIGHC